MGGFAETVECPGLALPVVDVSEQGEGMLVVLNSLAGLAEVGAGGPKAVQCPGLAVSMAELPEQSQRLLEVGGGQPGLVMAAVLDRASPGSRHDAMKYADKHASNGAPTTTLRGPPRC
jgi:hypothetical protein